MAVSQYFHHVDATEEKNLFHDLAAEFVQLSGIDVHYIEVAKFDGNYDALFGENRFEILGKSKVIEMYLKDMEKPYANDDFYAKFGLSQPDSCSFLVARRRFDAEFGKRPQEGDYIYIPVWNPLGPDDIFKIQKVDVSDYQNMPLGSPVYYFITCERARYTHQTVETTEPVLDQGAVDISNNNSTVNDSNADNDPLQILSNQFIQFDENNPFGTP